MCLLAGPAFDYPEEAMTTLPRHHYTYEEYLSYERDSERKHEFAAGEIIAMVGGSRRLDLAALYADLPH